MAAPAEESSRPRRQPGWRFTVPAVLLLLLKGSAHGYELLYKLPAVLPRWGPPPDPGAFYRTLRTLEENGCLRSSWDNSDSGPSRRVYELTDRGRLELEQSAATVRRDLQQLRRFLKAYEAAGGR